MSFLWLFTLQFITLRFSADPFSLLLRSFAFRRSRTASSLLRSFAFRRSRTASSLRLLLRRSRCLCLRFSAKPNRFSASLLFSFAEVSGRKEGRAKEKRRSEDKEQSEEAKRSKEKAKCISSKG
uniref:Uncharacterized protein n=1 Tax=Hydrodictyon reticulatum TaxID=3107 RepID=A0A1W6F7M4_HYDRE|nr:hypothetical protein [Hydrodictyon reticulatum]ARK36689.1 hypothetical protein [Hydrodictyon reticulatum]